MLTAGSGRRVTSSSVRGKIPPTHEPTVTELRSPVDFEHWISSSGDRAALLFHAAWCGPCRGFDPVFTQSASSHPSVSFAKADVDALPDLASQNSVTVVPTVAFFRDKKRWPNRTVQGADHAAFKSALSDLCTVIP